MANTLLRFGLYLLVLSLALYVIDSSMANSPIAELMNTNMLQYFFIASAAMIVAGIVLRVVSPAATKVLQKSNRCRVCDTVIPAGQIYCRPHLRGMLEREDRKTHNSRIR